MKKHVLRSMLLLLTAALFLHLEAMEGFYKDLFYDAGVGLDDQGKLYAGDYLKLSYEFYSGEDATQQNLLMVKNENDDNGVLLYPDGEPRFTVLYTCGGYGQHASSLGNEGKQRVRDFYYHGGGYNGSCHGNYLAWNWGYNFWPGTMSVDSYEGYVDGIIPDDSPLLRYYDFGGDHLIHNLLHFKGGYATGTLPEKTEVLLIGKSAGKQIDGDGHPTGWAYKAHDTTGRMCGMCDHPEYAQSGECMQYHAACILYARDGLASPHVKVTLVDGEERVMDKSTADKDPAHTKIGDKQYHHFRVAVPGGTSQLTATLDADDAYDMRLYIAKDTFAFASCAAYADTLKGADKMLSVLSPEAGTWYIGVECATTVTTTKTAWGYEYAGNLGVLNGVRYSIKADLTGVTSIHEKNCFLTGAQDRFWVKTEGRKIIIEKGKAPSCDVKIYDAKGRLWLRPELSQISGEYTWQPAKGGMYLVRIADKENVITKLVMVVK